MPFTCPICQTWVPDGSMHQCSGFWGGHAPTQPTMQPWFDNAALQRVAAALERIATMLETPKKVVKRRG